MSDSKKKEASETMAAFFKQFGKPDLHSKIVLEILLKEIYGKGKSKENLPIPSEEGQESSEDS